MSSGHILQIPLQISIQNQIGITKWVIINEVVQFRPLRHGYIQRVFNPGAVDGNFSPVPEQQLHAPGVHVEMTSSCIVLHVCVLSALRHLYSCDFRYTVFLIRFWTHSRLERARIVIPEENKKSEPFSYQKKVRILLLWCG